LISQQHQDEKYIQSLLEAENQIPPQQIEDLKYAKTMYQKEKQLNRKQRRKIDQIHKDENFARYLDQQQVFNPASITAPPPPQNTHQHLHAIHRAYCTCGVNPLPNHHLLRIHDIYCRCRVISNEGRSHLHSEKCCRSKHIHQINCFCNYKNHEHSHLCCTRIHTHSAICHCSNK